MLRIPLQTSKRLNSTCCCIAFMRFVVVHSIFGCIAHHLITSLFITSSPPLLRHSSLPHFITSSPHNFITSSPHHFITSSPHHLITSSLHHLITSSPHHFITS